jgi:hypothetical protein
MNDVLQKIEGLRQTNRKLYEYVTSNELQIDTERAWIPLQLSETQNYQISALIGVELLSGSVDQSRFLSGLVGIIPEEIAHALIRRINHFVFNKDFIGEFPDEGWHINNEVEQSTERMVQAVDAWYFMVPQKDEPIIAPRNPKLPLQRAMTEYPMLGQQTISSEMVKLRSQIAPVRGTLYNWIKAYRDELGVRKHDTIERTNFLFTSENGKKLTAEEKDHMHHVIEALEDGVAVEVDIKRQAIVWPGVMQSQQVAEVRVPDVQKSSSVPLRALQSQERVVDDAQIEITAAPYTVAPPAAPTSGPMGRVSFSTNHVLPSETPEYTGSELVDTWLAENQTPAADPAAATPPTARNMRM